MAEMLRQVLGTGPPLGCCSLMVLLVFGSTMLSCPDVELYLETLQEVWNGHRLLTHVLCAADVQLLVISLLLFPLLYWKLEQHVGTLYFLHLSCVCTLCSAIIFILLCLVLPVPAAPASGYLATQLSLLIAQGSSAPWRLGKKTVLVMSCGMIMASHYMCPQSSLLYHICGVINGLAVRSTLFRYLELSEARIRALDRMVLFRYMKSFPVARFIPFREKGSVLQDTGYRAQEQYGLPFSYTDVLESGLLANMPLEGVPRQTASLTHFQHTPVWIRDAGTLEEEMLEAGILASLRDYEQQESQRQELTLNKSSVSALRLQQLERMGFPTGPAVVALAATGKVERAVSLLVEGQVGEDIAVTSDRHMAHGLQNTQVP
ncbi:rhomboid domain-containing protein 3 [Hyperolius riggenbachi]|uniref:rhomboid domain-containing protein 3 n=1 Tax=Hyperolius riggenbachi TaxID=752182 RepID=UPI0035A363A9